MMWPIPNAPALVPMSPLGNLRDLVPAAPKKPRKPKSLSAAQEKLVATAEANYLQALDDISARWDRLGLRDVEEMVWAQEGDARAAVSLWLSTHRAEVIVFYEAAHPNA